MIFTLLLLNISLLQAGSPEDLWTRAAHAFSAKDNSGFRMLRNSPAQVKPRQEKKSMSLSELAQEISADPQALKDFSDQLVDALALNAQQSQALAQGLSRIDKTFLDKFPVLTPQELSAAAETYAKNQKVPPPAVIPPLYALQLTGVPRNPEPDTFLKDLGHGLKYGDRSLMKQDSAYGDNLEIAQALNWLASNTADDPSFTLQQGGNRFQSITQWLNALLKQGHTIQLKDMRLWANFGDLLYEKNGVTYEVATPLYINTGLKLKDGSPLIVPVTHSQLELVIRGPRVNADVVYFFGIDGVAGWRAKSTTNQDWVGGRAVEELQGVPAVQMAERAAWVSREFSAKNKGLPAGGYGPLGTCNDIHAFVTENTPYPMMRSAKYFAGKTKLDALSRTLPYDALNPPTVTRIFDSLPFDSVEKIPFPEVRESIEELRNR